MKLGAAAALGLILLLADPAAALAQAIDISPSVGYRFGGGFFERITNQSVDLDGAPTLGGVLNVALHDGLSFEGLFTHQAARLDVRSSAFAPPVRWQITVDHWMAGAVQEFGSGGRVSPFVTGLAGLTRYAAQDDNEIRFALSAGGGAKLRATRHLGVRLDGRVFTTFADLDGHAVACSPGICLVALHADVVWQAEFTAGLLIVF